MVKSYVSKVAGFYRSNHWIHSVKNVFLETCLQNSQEKACVRDSILIKLHSKGCEKETLAQLFSCEFCKISKNPFFTEYLRTTASAFSFSEAGTGGVLWKMCSWTFRKIHRRTPLVYEIFKNTFYKTPLDDCFWLFRATLLKWGYCQQCLENLKWIFIT